MQRISLELFFKVGFSIGIFTFVETLSFLLELRMGFRWRKCFSLEVERVFRWKFGHKKLYILHVFGFFVGSKNGFSLEVLLKFQ